MCWYVEMTTHFLLESRSKNSSHDLICLLAALKLSHGYHYPSSLLPSRLPIYLRKHLTQLQQ